MIIFNFFVFNKKKFKNYPKSGIVQQQIQFQLCTLKIFYNLLNLHECLSVYYKHTSTQAHKHTSTNITSLVEQKILVRIPSFFFLLFFGLTLLLSSCQKDNFITPEAEKFTKQRRKIDLIQLLDFVRLSNKTSFTGELQSAVPFNLKIDLKNYHFNSDSTVIFFQISDTSFFRNEYCGGNISFHYDDSLNFQGQLLGWMFDSTNTYLSNRFPLNLTTENGYLFAFDENENLIRILKSYNNLQTGCNINIPISELRDSINGIQNFFNSDWPPRIRCYDWDGTWWSRLWDNMQDWWETFGDFLYSIIPSNSGGNGGTGGNGFDTFFFGGFGNSNNGTNSGSGNSGGGGSGGGGSVPKKIWDEFCESLNKANNGTYGSQNGSTTVDERETSSGENNNELSDFDKKMTIYKDLLLSGKSCIEIYSFYLQTLNLNSTELAEILELGITLEEWPYFKDKTINSTIDETDALDRNIDCKSLQFVPVGPTFSEFNPEKIYQSCGVNNIDLDWTSSYLDERGNLRVHLVEYVITRTIYFEMPRIRENGSRISEGLASEICAKIIDEAEDAIEDKFAHTRLPKTTELEKNFPRTVKFKAKQIWRKIEYSFKLWSCTN